MRRRELLTQILLRAHCSPLIPFSGDEIMAFLCKILAKVRNFAFKYIYFNYIIKIRKTVMKISQIKIISSRKYNFH